MAATPSGRGGDHRAEWAVTVALSLAMLLVPAGFAVLLSAEGGRASSTRVAPAAEAGRASSDRSARMTFHLRDGALGMRILRGAPRDTRLVRGRRVRVVCGSVSGLVIRGAQWPPGADTLRVAFSPQILGSVEFCALKRGHTGIARVVFR